MIQELLDDPLCIFSKEFNPDVCLIKGKGYRYSTVVDNATKSEVIIRGAGQVNTSTQVGHDMSHLRIDQVRVRLFCPFLKIMHSGMTSCLLCFR